MADYQRMYSLLFNAITDSLRLLHRGNIAAAEYRLKKAQLQTERLYEETAPPLQIHFPKTRSKKGGE